MAKPIIGGPDTPKPQASRAECGGVEMKDVKPIPYSAPVGPTNQMRSGPGIGGANHGNRQSSIQVESASDPGEFTGRPGIGGSRMRGGSQR